MKVLVISSLYPNNVNPQHGIFIKERMTRVAKLPDVHVKVVAPVPYFPPVKLNSRYTFSQIKHHEIIDGIDVYHPRYVMTPKVGMALYGLFMFLGVLSTVGRIRREFDFDLIDAHFVYPDGFAAMLLSRWFEKPLAISARGSDINQNKDFIMIRKLVQFTLGSANKIIAVSQALKDAIVRLGIPEQSIVVIPNGIDPGKFAPIPRQNARAMLSLPNKTILLSVGNLTRNKGVDLLIKALKILVDKKKWTDLHLVIVGEGPCRDQLSSLVAALGLEEFVRLAGRIPNNELGLWYNAADLFCLVSGQEGLPNVVLESLACGTPVVATRVGGIPEVLTSNKVGLFTARDEQHLADAISLALARSWDRNALVQHVNGWTWNHVAAAVRRVFESVLCSGSYGTTAHAEAGGSVPN